MSTPARAAVATTETLESFQAAVVRAAALLRAGQVVALPTETVYGLAANAFDPDAVAAIFRLKGRPAHNPIIVHVATRAMARECVTDWLPPANQLASSFWPGPLTLVLPRAARVPAIVAAGGPTVAVRWPAHPFMQAVIRECGFPLAAPSANLSGEVSPTTAEHVRRALGGRIPLIVDGGPANVGIESTVVDLTVRPARVLRPGMIHEESLRAVLGEAGLEASPDSGGGEGGGVARSPGRLLKHYSPRARLVVSGWTEDRELADLVAGFPVGVSQVHVIVHTRIPGLPGLGRISLIPHDPAAYARAIYAELHRSDELGAELIVVEALPEAPEWRAIADRLRRAAA